MKQNQISDLEYKRAENTQSEQQKNKQTKIRKHEGSVRSLWDNFKCTNVCITGVPEEKRESNKLKTYVKI